MNDSSTRYILEMVTGSSPGAVYHLDKGVNAIGRHSSNGVCLNTEGLIVSKQHAVLVIGPGGIQLRDCGSTNGLFVNQQKIEVTDITPGDIIGFGENGPRLRFIVTPAKPPDPPVTVLQTVVHTDAPLISASSSAAPAPAENAESTVNATTSGGNDTTAVSRDAAEPPPDSEWDAIPLPLVGALKQISSDEAARHKAVTTREVLHRLNGKHTGAKNVNNGTFSLTQEFLFSKFKKVYHKKRLTTFLTAGGIILVLCVIAGFYATGYYRYDRMFAKSLTIRDEAVKADKEYESIRGSGTVQDEEKQRLLDSLRIRERRLDSLMTLLPRRYQQRFFKDPLEQRLYEIMVVFGEPNYHISSHMLEQVRSYTAKFSREYQKNDRLLTRWRTTYYPFIERTFGEHHLPVVLAYIAMQESLMNESALSKAGALGFWQFMPETAKQYGLVINQFRDERTDWQKSTIAAAHYLHDLISEIGDGRAVLLAIAAYNTGRNNVLRALREINDPLRERDFWYLYRTSTLLADETREYVPQVLARIIVGQYAEDFGL